MWLPVSVLYSCDLWQGTVLLHTEHLGFLALSKGLTNQFAIQTDPSAAIEEPEQAHKAHSTAASNNRDYTHDHSIVACSHHLHMVAFLCPHPIRGEPCIQCHAKKWQQNHSLQNFCKNWIFDGEGSTEPKLKMSHLQQLFTLHWYRRLRHNNDYSTYQHGRQMDLSMEWPKKLFQEANSGEIWFHQLKTKRKGFFN